MVHRGLREHRPTNEALPSEDGGLPSEYQVMHEENFLSCWLREDVDGKEKEREKLNKDAKEEESKSGKREVEVEGERETFDIKRRFLDRVSSEVFEVSRF